MTPEVILTSGVLIFRHMKKGTLISFFMIIKSFGSLAQSSSPVPSGQNAFWADMSGRPLYLQENYIAEGSPYFLDKYYFAEVTMVNGKLYKDIQVKVNILDNQVLYLTDDNKEMVSTSAIKRIQFYNITSEEGMQNVVLESFNGGLNMEKTPVYQVLDSGKYSLLKKISVTYIDSKGYGQSLVTRSFEHTETLYCQMPDGNIIKMGRGREAVLEICVSKRKLVEAFIDKNNLKCRTAKDFQMVFHYFNSIL